MIRSQLFRCAVVATLVASHASYAQRAAADDTHRAVAADALQADPLASVDLNRAAIVADIVQGLGGDGALATRLAKLRADHLLAASLASTRESLELILADAEKGRAAAVRRATAKAFGSTTRDLVYTPLTPCRLIDTRGFGAPIQGGAYAPGERRAYVPAGQCAVPTAGVSTLLVAFTTQNLTPNSGGYLAMLRPAAPLTSTVDVFNLGSEWSASNTAVATGDAGQFDVLVAAANAHVVVDILGYFGPPPAGSVGTAMIADAAVATAKIADAAVTTAKIADASITAGKIGANGCTNGQVLRFNGAAWACATIAAGGGSVTSVATGAGLTGGPITAAGTVSVATGGIATAMLADGAVTGAKIAAGTINSSHIAPFGVGAAQVNPFEIQRRVAGQCSRGTPLIGIAGDGAVVCDQPSLVVGVDEGPIRMFVLPRSTGLPIIANQSFTNNRPRLFDCADALCQTGTIRNAGGPASTGGFDLGAAMRSDDRMVTSYANGSGNQMVFICNDAACTGGTERAIDTGAGGTFTQVALRADNRPVIAYWKFTQPGTSYIYDCADVACTSGTSRLIVTDYSSPASIAVRGDGRPIVAFRSYGGGAGVYDCNDGPCTSGVFRGVAGGPFRFHQGIVARADNRPLIASSDGNVLFLYDCADAGCTSFATRQLASVGASSVVIRLRASGRPLIAFTGPNTGLFDCADAACNSGTVRLVDISDQSLSDTQLGLGIRPGDLPTLAFANVIPGSTTTGLRVISCKTATCQ